MTKRTAAVPRHFAAAALDLLDRRPLPLPAWMGPNASDFFNGLLALFVSNRAGVTDHEMALSS